MQQSLSMVGSKLQYPSINIWTEFARVLLHRLWINLTIFIAQQKCLTVCIHSLDIKSILLQIRANILFLICSQLAAIKTKKMYTHSNSQVNLLLCSVSCIKQEIPRLYVWTKNLSWTFATICMGFYFFTTFFSPWIFPHLANIYIYNKIK